MSLLDKIAVENQGLLQEKEDPLQQQYGEIFQKWYTFLQKDYQQLEARCGAKNVHPQTYLSREFADMPEEGERIYQQARNFLHKKELPVDLFSLFDDMQRDDLSLMSGFFLSAAMNLSKQKTLVIPATLPPLFAVAYRFKKGKKLINYAKLEELGAFCKGDIENIGQVKKFAENAISGLQINKGDVEVFGEDSLSDAIQINEKYAESLHLERNSGIKLNYGDIDTVTYENAAEGFLINHGKVKHISLATSFFVNYGKIEGKPRLHQGGFILNFHKEQQITYEGPCRGTIITMAQTQDPNQISIGVQKEQVQSYIHGLESLFHEKDIKKMTRILKDRFAYVEGTHIGEMIDHNIRIMRK